MPDVLIKAGPVADFKNISRANYKVTSSNAFFVIDFEHVLATAFLERIN